MYRQGKDLDISEYLSPAVAYTVLCLERDNKSKLCTLNVQNQGPWNGVMKGAGEGCCEISK